MLPIFVGNNDNAREPIEAMPDVYRYGCNSALEYLEPLVNRYGLRSVLLFPVVTRTDLANDDDNQEEEEDDDDDHRSQPVAPSLPSSISSASCSSSSEENSSSSDDQDGEQGSSVQPERLVDDETTGATRNPFLTQNEETDHLLGGEQQGGANHELATPTKATNLPVAGPPLPPPRANEQLIKISKTRDIKLIKGLALKDKHNPVLRLIPKLKAKFPGLLLICDVCLCAFTSTGHCCLFEDHTRAKANGSGASGGGGGLSGHYPISNKLTCQYLAMLALEYAKRGCDVIAPSDMMDGRILTIREKLNEHALHHVSILSYSAKFASAFYGPFRQATVNAPQFGDRRTYQLPPGSRALAMKAVQRDIDQGADFVMVKPGGAYLDVVRDICNAHPEVPVAVYQVSGEYSILKMAASTGLINLNQAVNETLTAFRRAGATIIITYFTPELLRGELLINDGLAQ